MSDRGFPLNLILRTTVLAAVGAFLGWLWRYGDQPFLSTATLVPIAAVLVGVALAMLVVLPGLRSTPPAPIYRRAPQPTVDGWWAEPPSAQHTTQPQGAVGQAETVRLVLPVDEPAPTATWWNQGPSTPPTPAPARAARPAAPDLASYRSSARVVQCPRCGAFRIDVTHVEGGYTFRCRVDDHEWTWRSGTAWPPTVVASRRRIQS